MTDVIFTKTIQVLEKPVIEINEKYEYARATLQVWTGKIAGQMQVYTKEVDFKKPTDLQGLIKGEYEIDLEEVHGKYGSIEPRYVNPRLLKHPSANK